MITIDPGYVQIGLTAALVSVTSVYAWRTHVISKSAKEQAEATREQAEASVKMAEEMREQRIMTSRPIIIQKDVYEERAEEGRLVEFFSHFEVYNEGNGTAIEVEVILLDQWKKPQDGKREGFLRAGESPMKFHPTLPPSLQGTTFYIVSEYQGIPSHSPQPIWYQTWLPCNLSISGKVIRGKLEFHEVSEENRIGIFNREFNNVSKPK